MDYRELNKITDADTYPMPNVETLVEEVAAANFITTLDLTKGYYQVPLPPSEQPKTAFVTERGKFQAMPFGLKGAPAHFQRVMDNILRDVPHCHVYIDDIVVFTLE